MPSPGVKARIDRFWRAVERMKEISSDGLEAFLGSQDRIDAGERNLQVAVEALVDVGEALISAMRWRTPRSYRDVGEVLRENSVLSKEEAKTFTDIVRLRNILVHNYICIDPETLYETLKRLPRKLAILIDKILKRMERERE